MKTKQVIEYESKIDKQHIETYVGMQVHGLILSKREYFAAMAMPMLLGKVEPNRVCPLAVEYADELIAELDKEPEEISE